MHAALESGWLLAMVILIHQKTGDLGEGSTHTTSDCNEEMEEDVWLHGARTVRTRTREHVWLWWKLDVTGGQFGPGGRTVRSSNSNCTREGVFSG